MRRRGETKRKNTSQVKRETGQDCSLSHDSDPVPVERLHLREWVKERLAFQMARRREETSLAEGFTRREKDRKHYISLSMKWDPGVKTFQSNREMFGQGQKTRQARREKIVAKRRKSARKLLLTLERDHLQDISSAHLDLFLVHTLVISISQSRGRRESIDRVDYSEKWDSDRKRRRDSDAPVTSLNW